MSKPIYKLVDSKGRVLIPKALRETAHMEYGDIVRIGLSSGRITVTRWTLWRLAISHRKQWKPMCVRQLKRCRTANVWNCLGN